MWGKHCRRQAAACLNGDPLLDKLLIAEFGTGSTMATEQNRTWHYLERGQRIFQTMG
jgi:hypothetical protein